MSSIVALLPFFISSISATLQPTQSAQGLQEQRANEILASVMKATSLHKTLQCDIENFPQPNEKAESTFDKVWLQRPRSYRIESLRILSISDGIKGSFSQNIGIPNERHDEFNLDEKERTGDPLYDSFLGKDLKPYIVQRLHVKPSPKNIRVIDLAKRHGQNYTILEYSHPETGEYVRLFISENGLLTGEETKTQSEITSILGNGGRRVTSRLVSWSRFMENVKLDGKFEPSVFTIPKS